MDYFPGVLSLEGRRCVVVGGGDVALRKARLLHSAGAVLSVIAPATSPAFAEYIERHGLFWTPREFRAADLDGAWLVVTATGRSPISNRSTGDISWMTTPASAATAASPRA